MTERGSGSRCRTYVYYSARDLGDCGGNLVGARVNSVLLWEGSAVVSHYSPDSNVRGGFGSCVRGRERAGLAVEAGAERCVDRSANTNANVSKTWVWVRS
jgi:hypothetical protein